MVAANVRALITGEGELTRYETFPPMIAIRSGPRGEPASSLTASDPATIAELKGRDVLIGRYAELFDAVPTAA